MLGATRRQRTGHESMWRAFAHAVDARSERHGAEAPRKSDSGLSRFGQSRVGERRGRARQLCHLTRRRIQVRAVTLAAKMVHSGTTSNASEYKCGNNRGSASLAIRMQASQHPTNSQGSRPVSAVHPPSWGLTLPSRGRPTSGFTSCRPPLMSNVSPQRNASSLSGVVQILGNALSCSPTVLHRSRANGTRR